MGTLYSFLTFISWRTLVSPAYREIKKKKPRVETLIQGFFYERSFQKSETPVFHKMVGSADNFAFLLPMTNAIV